MNPKAVAGRARKAEAAERKAAEKEAQLEAEEDAKWQQGARGKSAADTRNEKAAEKARKKAELQRLTEEDDANTPSKPSGTKGASSKNKAGGGGVKKSDIDDLDMQIAALNATSLDDALEAMSLVNARSDKAGRGADAASIDRHPERRFKSAFEAYKERELPKLTEERPGLRFGQYQDALYKQFQVCIAASFSHPAEKPGEPFQPGPRGIQRDQGRKVGYAQGQARCHGGTPELNHIGNMMTLPYKM